MNTKLLIISISIVSVFLIIGWYGVTITGTMKADDHDVGTEYDYYLIEPVLFTAWECYNPFYLTEPCGFVPNRIHHYNAQVSLLFFLCRDIAENDSIIINFYNNKVDKYLSVNTISPNNSTSICEDIIPFHFM